MRSLAAAKERFTNHTMFSISHFDKAGVAH